jgi:hypothetical protein
MPFATVFLFARFIGQRACESCPRMGALESALSGTGLRIPFHIPLLCTATLVYSAQSAVILITRSGR